MTHREPPWDYDARLAVMREHGLPDSLAYRHVAGLTPPLMPPPIRILLRDWLVQILPLDVDWSRPLTAEYWPY